MDLFTSTSCRFRWAALCAAALAFLPVRAQEAFRPVRQFPPGALRGIADLPDGPFRRQLERLPASGRQRAVEWLRSFHFGEHDLGTLQHDSSGGIFYVDPAPPPVASTAETELPEVAGAAVAVSPFPAGLVFHSRPGAPNVIFLNFAGETVTGTEWNTSLGRTSVPATAFSVDADLTTFSDSEQLAIRRVWERVAEDYAPFNVDVTTERPASFGARTAQALITRHTDANGALNPSSTAGGVAYVNVFGTTSYSRYRPAWIYHDNLSNEESFIAEAVAHEVGHNLGLSHDGTTAGADYYNGHGAGETSWGPLMGTGYNRNVSQWSKGEYYQANNQQDDLSLIAGKLTYRTDDHGNTTAAATTLVLSGGTNVVATTPANDPANLNPDNKGVIERATDLDTFAFVTGPGPVRFTVTPWIVPSGRTRGGNLDVQLQLLDSAGTVLQTVQPADQTGAVLATNLAAGRYFLQVRNAAAGSPLGTSPTGYTGYGSLGQYFLDGFVSAPDGVVVAPVAALTATDLSSTGVGAFSFTVTYSDDFAVKATTLDGNDVRITGPNGFDRLARLTGVSPSGDGTPLTATYAVDAPNGIAWLPADNGTYGIRLEAGQVSDTLGTFAAAGSLGTFRVAVPTAIFAASMDSNPGWTLEGDWAWGAPSYGASGPAGGFTGATILGYNLGGNYPNRLTTRYATTPPINTAGSTSLTLHFRRWLRLQNGDTALVEVSTNGTSWTRLWTGSRRIADTSWQEVQYPLPAGFAGSATVRFRWGMGSNNSQNDLGWNLDDVQLLGDGTLDTFAPVASLSVAPLTVGGSPSHPCSVTYTDATAVRLSSLDAADLAVTGPNGLVGTVEFIGADLPADGTPITATYSITAPGGTWDAADNGTYEIQLAEDEVTDAGNNGVSATPLGSFAVNIPSSTLALVVEPVALDVPEGGEGSFTVRLSEMPSTTVTVSVQRQSGDESVTVKSGATLSFSRNTWNTPAKVTLSATADADETVSSAVFDVRSAGLATVTVIANKVDWPTGQLDVVRPDPIESAGPVGGPFTPGQWSVSLTNSGGSSLVWSVSADVAWLAWSAATGTLAPTGETKLTLVLTPAAAALPPGTHFATVGFTNLSTGRGDTAYQVTLLVRAESTAHLTVKVTPAGAGSVSPDSGP